MTLPRGFFLKTTTPSTDKKIKKMIFSYTIEQGYFNFTA